MISVVIPAYNEEKFISECLESLKKQDYRGEFEIIVVDNGSQDNTARIARDFGVRVVKCPQKGVSYARQAGVEAARGRIIVQADADTVYPSWWLARIQKQFDKHPGAVAVAGCFVYRNPPWWSVFEIFLRAFWNLMATWFLGRPYIISGANLAFYKKAFTQIGGYDPKAYSSDQFNIASRLSKAGKVIYDMKSFGATSERSVAKPTMVIIFEFIRNLSRFGNNYFKGSTVTIKKQAKKVTSVSTGTYLKVVIPALLISLLCYGYFVPASPVFGKVYAGSGTREKVIALTFDDGPNEPYTSEILDILHENGVPATFFLVGANVKLYPDVAKRIQAEGNVIGNHTYSHSANHALSFNSLRDIEMAQQTIIDVVGVSPHLYRPPHGKKTPWELEGIKKAGLVEILWNIATNELSGRSWEYLADQIIAKARPGGIILLHDGYGTQHNTTRSDKSDTVKMLPVIIGRLQSQGYTFVTIPELLNVPAYVRISE